VLSNDDFVMLPHNHPTVVGFRGLIDTRGTEIPGIDQENHGRKHRFWQRNRHMYSSWKPRQTGRERSTKPFSVKAAWRKLGETQSPRQER